MGGYGFAILGGLLIAAAIAARRLGRAFRAIAAAMGAVIVAGVPLLRWAGLEDNEGSLIIITLAGGAIAAIGAVQRDKN